MKTHIKILMALLIVTTLSFSETVYVKYRGNVDVDNGHFSKLQIGPSSFVKEMYYDKNNEYLLVSLRGTYYHYCYIPENIVSQWVDSPSIGRYYNASIKGNYGCRYKPVPNY